MNRRNGPSDQQYQSQRDRDPQGEWPDDTRGGHRAHRGQPAWDDERDDTRGGRAGMRDDHRGIGRGDRGGGYGHDDDRGAGGHAAGSYGSDRDFSRGAREDYPERGWGNFARNDMSRGWDDDRSRQEPDAGRWAGSHRARSGSYEGGAPRFQGESQYPGQSAQRQGGAAGYGSSDYHRDEDLRGRGGDAWYGERAGGQGRFGGGYGEGGGLRGYGADERSGQRDPRYGSQRGAQYGQSSGYGQGAGNDHRGRGPKGYTRSDERLKEDISERLSDDPQIDASDITVEVKGGVVTLTGQVEQRWIKYHVEDLVDRCPGVQDIENRLGVTRSQDATGRFGSGGMGASGVSDPSRTGTQATGDAVSATQSPGGRKD